MLWYPCAAHLVVGIDEIGHRYRPTRVRLFGYGEPRYLKASHRLRQRRFDSEDEAARAAGLDRSVLIEQEITSKVQPVTESEIATWYQANQARAQGASLDQVRQPIRAYLIQERMQDIRAKYLDELKSKTRVRVMLDPPRQVLNPSARQIVQHSNEMTIGDQRVDEVRADEPGSAGD